MFRARNVRGNFGQAMGKDPNLKLELKFASMAVPVVPAKRWVGLDVLKTMGPHRRQNRVGLVLTNNTLSPPGK